MMACFLFVTYESHLVAVVQEEGLRFRKMAAPDQQQIKSADAAPAAGQHANAESPVVIPPMVYIALALILGLLLGKFFL